MILSIDIECFSTVDIKCGVYRYAEEAEIILFAYSVDGSPVTVIDLTAGECIPAEIVEMIKSPDVIKTAYNANFERVLLSHFLGVKLDPSSWRCTMVHSAYLGLPFALGQCGEVLKLDKQKMTEGKELIKLFCVPDREGNRRMPADYPEEWETFKKYNARDVEVEMQIHDRLSKYPVPEHVWEEYALDQRINDRGVLIDEVLVRSAIALSEGEEERIFEALQGLTGVENPRSVMQFTDWLKTQGIETTSLDKAAVEELLKEADEPARTALIMRKGLTKSSVKKYEAMQKAKCKDGRIRGMTQFYGAQRTGRFAGRVVQLQNLKRNSLPELSDARELVKQKSDILPVIYPSVADVLSELVRTALIPRPGNKFVVADFSSIEARALSYLAGERWKVEAFHRGEDIYCTTASRMFGVPVVKHGVNGELRQRGKVAELGCIAENELVLTDAGLVPIQNVTGWMKVWDGEEWVSHAGVIYKGEREVITYEGLTATEDHIVFVDGKHKPVSLGEAAACGLHLIQTGDGGREIRMGDNNKSREKMERENEPLLCGNKMRVLRKSRVAAFDKLKKRKIKRLSVMFSKKENTKMARQKTDSSKAEVHKSERQRLQKLRSKRDNIRFSECYMCRTLSDRKIRNTRQEFAARQDRQQRELCTGKYTLRNKRRKLCKQKVNRVKQVCTGILALCENRCIEKTLIGNDKRRNNTGCRTCCQRKKKKLEVNRSKARVYDLLDAGRNHRFTVSGKLVHNCGYGGSVGALKSMGALKMGLKEEELQPLVDQWRAANPHIVNYWYEVDRAAKTAIKERVTTRVGNVSFTCRSGMLFIHLPSGRSLSYVKPGIGENRFGGESITYYGLDTQKKWVQLESYGAKLVENITQAICRDILCYAMSTLSDYDIVAHVHDEVIIEADKDTSVEEVCELMSVSPKWIKGLELTADGYECDFYKKD